MNNPEIMATRGTQDSLFKIQDVGTNKNQKKTKKNNFLLFYDLRWEVVACFVDIGRVVDRHYF